MKKFTVIIDVFYKIDLFKITIDAILNQSYKNLEIIIINNGASDDIINFILELESKDNRIKIIHYKENVFDIDDPMCIVEILQDALMNATGDYVFYNSYDDVMANDYIERMINLFEENPKSISAAGLPVSINCYGDINESELKKRTSNFRPRHCKGNLLALDSISRKSKNLFDAPGTIFSFKREKLIEMGGYHKCLEISQIIGVVPFGETSFDEKAIFYWRRHENQVNHLLTKRGFNDIKDFNDLLLDWKIKDKWSEHYGSHIADKLIKNYLNKVYLRACNVMFLNLSNFNFKGAIRPLKDGGQSLIFWKNIPVSLSKNYKIYILNVLKKVSPFKKAS